ncbi:hypothetical protein CEUSTIGMA_g3400.t1 [Chlamydomonas eustigma]|uniref:AAA+ ATPase domain-containing protein n=1 Tax=Chlamydomonas eustigma TaxID=1157962 RepID=A0A250WYN5_9CHLO|nr:hypothetical protein CEUSTIGMA_g3400.t1 [Chlamydomonas eustigma]|eukprot:GAX75957.1 hypothetical protein CEUSTIGMA_g3400.t1 [Chlamydomonas eustigma]
MSSFQLLLSEPFHTKKSERIRECRSAREILTNMQHNCLKSECSNVFNSSTQALHAVPAIRKTFKIINKEQPSLLKLSSDKQTQRTLVIAQAAPKKPKLVYICQVCGHEHVRSGNLKCENCGEFGKVSQTGTAKREASGRQGPAAALLSRRSSSAATAPPPSIGISQAYLSLQKNSAATLTKSQSVSISGSKGIEAGQRHTGLWPDEESINEGNDFGEEGEEDEDEEGASVTQPSVPRASGTTSSRGWLDGGGRASSSAPATMAVMRRAGIEMQAVQGGAGPGVAQRIRLSGKTGTEVGRVLSGPTDPGVVSGSFVLVGGDPGIGKSTLMLQLAAMVSDPCLDFDKAAAAAAAEAREAGRSSETDDDADVHAPGGSNKPPALPQDASKLRSVLYISGEEKDIDVFKRADRMGLGNCSSLMVWSCACMDDIFNMVDQMKPQVIIVDSIQTMYMDDISGSPGSPSQVKECAQALRQISNGLGITVFLIGHVTKQGEVAGPKMLEHIVDTVLFLEGESGEGRRLLRVHKNRHGPTDEVGVFRMDGRGMHAVDNPSSLFIEDAHGGEEGGGGQAAVSQGGAAVLGVAMMGSRPVLLEVQALCSKAYSKQQNAPLVRQATGVSRDRFIQLVHVMSKVLHSARGLSGQHIYCTVVRGMQFKEPASDLAMAVAIASSYFDVPVPPRVAVLGEVDLAGRLRTVGRLEQRLAEVAQLGICDMCIVPKGAGAEKMAAEDPRLEGLNVMPCGSLLEALREVLGSAVEAGPPDRRGWGASSIGAWGEGHSVGGDDETDFFKLSEDDDSLEDEWRLGDHEAAAKSNPWSPRLGAASKR